MGTDRQQGPDAGRVLAPERETYRDPRTNARVTRLTSDPEADSRHLYFTENGWYDDQLLVRSNRDGNDDLYAVDLDDGTITQLTDLPRAISGVTRVDRTETAVFWHDNSLFALDLGSLAVTALYDCPAGYEGSIAAARPTGSV
ncbi:oligogalacturonate lyase family protein [Halocatena salina]|uniref:Oligogalacturonate lyase family protein n=1 Tax=Halocatena salina TaxID=2934340 RepID=A0A8U0A600_9EURY|nr:oligogalacturonate lyase family protein [Halocatena salina]UPM44279.1 oligogalacturonate lyase family protein [Halocatena salina]